MAKSTKAKLLRKALTQNKGILRLAPAWVPRQFLRPGGRLKLCTNDLYRLGADRGGIQERWLASTTKADNGPGTPADEGLSHVIIDNKKAMLLKEAIELEPDLILGKEIVERYGGWNVLAKFFDTMGPIPHHLHQSDEQVKALGKRGKPEAYYFPKQLNLTENTFPYTFFGLSPGTTKKDIRSCLQRWNEGDNGILDYSQAYRIQTGTGWFVPACILHAPGSLLTYEVQAPSDVFAMFQSMIEGRPVSWDLVTRDLPKDKHHDLDYIVSLIDWKANLDEHFRKNHYRQPKLVAVTQEQGYQEKWVVYDTADIFSAKELTVPSQKSVTIKDDGAYGLVVLEGHGTIGGLMVESPTIIGYDDLSYDELFVSTETARTGVKFVNSGKENLVALKHFGPGTDLQGTEAKI